MPSNRKPTTTIQTPEHAAHRKSSRFTPTSPEDVFGSLPFAGSAKTLKEMDAAVADDLRRAHTDDIKK